MNKILALYLPQFHKVEENDKWWGKGFTEWSAVRAAKPLFPGHCQPVIPYEENYYDLLQKNTMEWQANLMHKYGIDGMCIYHYYFKDGRKILETPAENLLKWADIDMPFCFSWANEPWVRSWSNLNDGNPWSEVIDRQIVKEPGDTGILIEQQYGTMQQWKKHFEYLLPFFKDKRYIRKDGKPVFLFYKAQSIGCLREMTDFWRKLAIQEGFPGLYLMGANCDESARQNLDEAFIQEPQDTMFQYPDKYRNSQNIERYLSFDEIWKKILEKPVPRYPVSLGGFSGYDDSPRRGRRSTVVYGKAPDKFALYMEKLIRKAQKCNSSFVIVNAWNEWGEGMYLEPDEQNGMAFLEAIKKAEEKARAEEIMDIEPKEKECNPEIYETEIANLRKQVERYRSFWYLLNGLLTLQERDISIAEYLQKKGYPKVAIYGLGMVGKHLAAELEKSGYEISFGIDQSENQVSQFFHVITLQDNPPKKTDLIIVTVTYDFSHIKEQISRKYSCEVISLKTILDEMID